MGKEVACGPISAMIKYVEERGIRFETWHKDIEYDLKHLQNIHERVEWSVLCQLFKNIKPHFTDEEFRLLYDNRGLNSKDVATIIHNNPAFKDQDVSAPAISKIINSIVKDVHLRSFLGRYFRYELIKKQKLNI